MTPKFSQPLAVSRRARVDQNLVVVSIRGVPARMPTGICSKIGNGKKFQTMILREPKAIGHARSVEIAETAAVVVVVGAVETSVRVLRIVRPAGERPLRDEPRPAEAASTSGSDSGDRPRRPRSGDRPSSDRGPREDRPRDERRPERDDRRRDEPRPAAAPPISCAQPYPRPAVSMISALEFLKSNHEPLCRRPTNPTRFPLVGLVRNPSRKFPNRRCSFAREHQINESAD